MGFRLNKTTQCAPTAESCRFQRATVAGMYTAPGIITLIVAALVGTVIGNLVQLRYFIDKPFMKSPLVRYGSLVLAILIMLNIIPDPDAQFTTTELMTYGLWWVLIAFLVSFVRPPTPLPPRGGQARSPGDTDPAETQTIDAEPLDLDEPGTEPVSLDEPDTDHRDDR